MISDALVLLEAASLSFFHNRDKGTQLKLSTRPPRPSPAKALIANLDYPLPFSHVKPAMNYTQSTHDSSESHSIPIGSISSLPVILTASVVLLAVDATITIFRRRTRGPTPITAEPPTIPPPLTRFVDKTRSILADVQALEKQLHSEKARRRRLSSERKRLSQDQCSASPTARTRPHTEPSCAFSAFCDRLLLTNRIWKQEKELKALRASAATRTQARNDTAFAMFCEQLLLWNRIWKLEREAVALGEEKARIQRERVAAVTRAAKRMVLDVQKERLVEEFVKDLIGEVAAAKAEVGALRAEHEREVVEINGDWLRDYRKVVGELEQLRLAREAWLVEQEVANVMEESLFESLREEKRRVEALEKAVEEDEVTLNGASGAFGDAEDHDDEATDVELDTLSELSTSSTCVSSGGSVQRATKSGVMHRRRCASQGALAPAKSSPHSRSSTLHSPKDDAAVALKPLLFDQAKSISALSANMAVATRTCNHSGRPLAIRNRTTSVSVRSPSSASGSGIKGATVVKARAPWRV